MTSTTSKGGSHVYYLVGVPAPASLGSRTASFSTRQHLGTSVKLCNVLIVYTIPLQGGVWLLAGQKWERWRGMLVPWVRFDRQGLTREYKNFAFCFQPTYQAVNLMKGILAGKSIQLYSIEIKLEHESTCELLQSCLESNYCIVDIAQIFKKSDCRWINLETLTILGKFTIYSRKRKFISYLHETGIFEAGS